MPSTIFVLVLAVDTTLPSKVSEKPDSELSTLTLQLCAVKPMLPVTFRLACFAEYTPKAIALMHNTSVAMLNNKLNFLFINTLLFLLIFFVWQVLKSLQPCQK